MKLTFTYFSKIILCAIMLVICLVTTAQVKFSTAVDTKEASLDNYIEVEYTIENGKSIENFSPPSFKGFRVVQGPSQSSNLTIINGVTSRSQSISYVLQPETTGKLIISGATATIDGKTMHSDPITVQINKQGGGQRKVQPTNQMPIIPEDFFEERAPVAEDYKLRPGEDVKDKINKNLIVKLDVNKISCYEGEPVIATYKLCSRVKCESKITKRPSLNGFSVYDMVDPGNTNLTVEKINGKNFNVHLIRRSQLFPLQAGSYTLDPVELENKVQFVRVTGASSSGSRSSIQRLMDEFFGREEMGEVEEHSIILRSNPVAITVRPLPAENKPAGFKGAVGKFAIQAELKNKTIAAGDAAQLQVIIEGTGNLPVVNAPEISLPNGMEAFDPQVKEDIDKTFYPLKGSKTFDYTFIAHDTGSFTIPPVQFSYFDPATASYKTLNSDSFTIRVIKGNKSYTAPLVANTNTGSSPAVSDSISKQTWIMGVVIVLLTGIIIYLLRKNRGSKKDQPAIVSSSVASVEKPITVAPAIDPLQEARLALHNARSQAFYSEVNKAIWQVASQKAAIPATELNKFNVSAMLQQKGVTIETIDALRNVLNECELALYTPIHEERDMRMTLDKAEQVVKSIACTTLLIS